MQMPHKIRTVRIGNFQDRKSVHLFHFYSDASEIYFQKDLFRLRGTNAINIILKCQSNT